MNPEPKFCKNLTYHLNKERWWCLEHNKECNKCKSYPVPEKLEKCPRCGEKLLFREVWIFSILEDDNENLFGSLEYPADRSIVQCIVCSDCDYTRELWQE